MRLWRRRRRELGTATLRADRVRVNDVTLHDVQITGPEASVYAIFTALLDLEVDRVEVETETGSYGARPARIKVTEDEVEAGAAKHERPERSVQREALDELVRVSEDMGLYDWQDEDVLPSDSDDEPEEVDVVEDEVTSAVHAQPRWSVQDYDEDADEAPSGLDVDDACDGAGDDGDLDGEE